MKSQILKFLRSSDDFVSGETISAKTGISRVAVWKHIKDLQKKGYDIDASPSHGYKLGDDGDFLYPWEFDELEYCIRHFDTCTSTMEKALELYLKYEKQKTILIAETQTKGRGRQKRKWVSARGGLYFTLMLKPDLPVFRVREYGFKAAACLTTVLRNTYHLPATSKWPNDVLLDNKKVAGVLVEFGGEINRINYLHLGIGINVNNQSPRISGRALTIKKWTGKEIKRKELLKNFLKEFNKL
jgi:BirA family biotin operon repressor/biotin-[acetyl-CoA-carboxylase] ligase